MTEAFDASIHTMLEMLIHNGGSLKHLVTYVRGLAWPCPYGVHLKRPCMIIGYMINGLHTRWLLIGEKGSSAILAINERALHAP